jgi:glycosyltransferase A (GT-A) superfamily protein (DUF2064 family)
MSQSKNALLLFSKPPIAGLVKTRLTRGRGGALNEEEAAEFFKCCILDITELSMLALDDLEQANWEERENVPLAPIRSYDFVVSTTPRENLDVMRHVFEEGSWDRAVHFICDQGASFDEHFDDAFGQLFDKGYDNIVAIGADHPIMTREHIVDAFQWLNYFQGTSEYGYGFVQAACQESGVSIIGKTKTTPMSARGVFYNTSGRPALDAYTEALRGQNIPNAFLSPVADVDRDSDLAHAISCINAMAEAAPYQTELFIPKRVLAWFDRMGLQATSPPNDEHDPRQYIDRATVVE